MFLYFMRCSSRASLIQFVPALSQTKRDRKSSSDADSVIRMMNRAPNSITLDMHIFAGYISKMLPLGELSNAMSISTGLDVIFLVYLMCYA